MRIAALALAMVLLDTSGGFTAQEAVPVDGAPFNAHLAAVDHDWNLVFATEEGQRTIPAAEFVRWGAPRAMIRGPVIVLANGGLLIAEVINMDGLTLSANSPLFGPISLPLDQVAGIAFQLPPDPCRQTYLLDRPLQAAGHADRMILENGDELTGLIDALDPVRARIQTSAGPVEAERRAVAAVHFNPALAKPEGFKDLYAWVGLGDGSLFPAAAVALDGQTLAVQAIAGHNWQTSAEELAFLQIFGGRTVYLSAVALEEYRHVPYLELPWPFRSDRSVAGGRLRCGGRTYLTGLGMHAEATITYRVNAAYERFQAEVGVDDSTQGRGSVRFHVLVDGRERFASNPVRGGDSPMPIDLDIAGAEQIDLVVGFAERAHVLDHANWLDARLIAPPDRSE